MITNKEKELLLAKLPTEEYDSLSTENIIKSILALQEKDKIIFKYGQQLEDVSLSYESLYFYFNIQNKIRLSSLDEEDLRELSSLANNHYELVNSYELLNQASMLAIKSVSDKCPNCGQPLILRNVSEPEGRKNKYGWKSSWFCDCGYEKFSSVSHREQAISLIKKSEETRKHLYSQLKDSVLVNRVLAKNLVCPQCSSVMLSYSINIPKGRKNVFGWKSVKRCMACLYEEYSLDESNI